MDGTLFDSRFVVPQAYIETVVELNGPRYTPEEIVAAYAIGPPRAMLSHLLDRPVQDAEVERYLDRLGRSAPAVDVYPGIREALAALHERLPLAVYTGASTRAARLMLEAVGLDAWFAEIVGADRVERPKPWPDGIELACELLGVPVGDAAYVGDAPGDLEAARRSGALAVAAAWGHLYSAEEAADVVAARPEDLIALLS